MEANPERRRTGFPESNLQDLLDAVSLIASELDPQVLLTRIAQAAADLVDARYGALGVIARDGTLDIRAASAIDHDMPTFVVQPAVSATVDPKNRRTGKVKRERPRPAGRHGSVRHDRLVGGGE